MEETKKQILEILLLPYILRLTPNAHCRRPLGGLIVPLPITVPTVRKEWGQEKEQKGAQIFQKRPRKRFQTRNNKQIVDQITNCRQRRWLLYPVASAPGPRPDPALLTMRSHSLMLVPIFFS